MPGVYLQFKCAVLGVSVLPHTVNNTSPIYKSESTLLLQAVGVCNTCTSGAESIPSWT
eukprot:COSAG02_NODE_29602_length_566_cov_0.991435_1_plen_58_part_00